MNTSESTGAAISAPKPITADSELFTIIFARLGELQQQIDNLGDVNDFQADVLDMQGRIIARLSQRLTAIEDSEGVAPRITLPPSSIQHNPRPGALKAPKTRGQVFREKYLAADGRRSKAIAETNSKPRVTKKGKK